MHEALRGSVQPITWSLPGKSRECLDSGSAGPKLAASKHCAQRTARRPTRVGWASSGAPVLVVTFLSYMPACVGVEIALIGALVASEDEGRFEVR